jgi:hypothetical protein
VKVDELVRGVRALLDPLSSAACAALDSDGDRVVTVNELVAAVAAALRGCSDTAR